MRRAWAGNDLLVLERFKDWSCSRGCLDPDSYRCLDRNETMDGVEVAVHCKCPCHTTPEDVLELPP